jgi:hypothetical protein
MEFLLLAKIKGLVIEWMMICPTVDISTRFTSLLHVVSRVAEALLD